MLGVEVTKFECCLSVCEEAGGEDTEALRLKMSAGGVLWFCSDALLSENGELKIVLGDSGNS